MLRILVCVSGGGTNLQAVIDAIGERQPDQYGNYRCHQQQ